MSIFGSIGKLVGKVIKPISSVGASMVPGGSLIQKAVGAVGSKLGTKAGRQIVKYGAVAGGVAAAGGLAAMMGGKGATNTGRRYRRINPGNTRAMRRAVRRVEAGAKLYSKFFSIKHGHIKGAPRVRLARRRRAA